MNEQIQTRYTFDESILSDLHKDAYGFRPRDIFWEEWSLADDNEKQEIWDRLVDIMRGEAELERARQLKCEAELEHTIEVICSKIVGSTREDAIRFLHDAYDTHGDVEYLEYNLGVRYGYLSGNINPIYS